MTTVALYADLPDPGLGAALGALTGYLRRAGDVVVAWPADAEAVLVWADRPPPDGLVDALLARAAAGVPVLLGGPTLAAWRDLPAVCDAAGVVPGVPMPAHEARVRPGPDAGEVTRRLPGDLVVRDRWLRLDKAADDVERLLTANAALEDHPVMTWRPTGVGTCSLGSAAAALRDPALQRLLRRWVRHCLGLREPAPVRVGLLGYGAIGAEHAEAVAAVDGLELAAVCDRNPARVEAARALAPGARGHHDPDALLADAGFDLVVVSTPPNAHADWALRVLAAGKHCVVEKPFALTTAEADEMVAAAAAGGLALSVYQNRRWDSDYLAVKALVRSGALGEVFHVETFVGGYGHPCNYWHSDEAVSGGAVYDWGSHYLDWLLDLLPGEVEHVTAAAHKLVWHDVTNADHSRVTLRFAAGAEAEFVHSDLAAAMKPKWYVLGTGGALVGSWRQETVLGRDAVGNLVEDRLAASESPASLWLHAPDGSTTAVALPPRPAQPFHRELADALLSGEPPSVTPAGSRRNVAVMEAATLSAREGGRPVRPR